MSWLKSRCLKALSANCFLAFLSYKGHPYSLSYTFLHLLKPAMLITLWNVLRVLRLHVCMSVCVCMLHACACVVGVYMPLLVQWPEKRVRCFLYHPHLISLKVVSSLTWILSFLARLTVCSPPPRHWNYKHALDDPALVWMLECRLLPCLGSNHWVSSPAPLWYILLRSNDPNSLSVLG